MPNPREQLIRRIRSHIEATGSTPTRFGRDVMNDPNFVLRLEAGADVRWSTIEFLNDWMDGKAVERKGKNATPVGGED